MSDHRENRDALDRHTKWLVETDRQSRTPERVAELREQARETARRHDTGESIGKRR